MAPRRTRAKDLRRKVARRPERKTVVVFCEGEASEPDYVNGLKRLPEIRDNTALVLEIDARQGQPLLLVEWAIERARDDEIDECWCVFDVEWPKNHPYLDEAIRLAEQNGIRLAISNPCFELWLILHHRDHTAFLTTSDAEKKSRALDKRAGKRIDPQVYMPLRRAAVDRAAKLARRHERDRTSFPDDNPSSTMGGLLDAIEPY